MTSIHRAALGVLAALAALALSRGASASPFAYVANEDSNDVTVVDLATKTVRATAALGVSPSDVAVSTDGRTAYVTSGASLVLVDTRSFGKTTIPLSQPGANGVAVAPGGGRVFVSHSDFAVLSEWRPANGTLSTIGLPAPRVQHIAVSPLGDFLYAVTSGGDILQLNLATNVSRRLFGGGEMPSPSGVAVDTFGSVWLGSVANQNVKVFSVGSTGNPLLLSQVTSGFRPGRIGIDRAGGFGAVALVPDPDASRVLRFFGATITIPNAAKPRDADASADRVIAIANGRDASGVAPAGFGSVSIVPPSGPATHLPAGDDPVAVAVGPAMWPEITAFPTLLLLSADFGMTASRPVTVTSSGWDPLAVGALRIGGRHAARFAITGDTCSGRSVPAGGTCTVTVTFTAPPLGMLAFTSYTAALEIPSNAQGVPIATVSLSGRAGIIRLFP